MKTMAEAGADLNAALRELHKVTVEEALRRQQILADSLLSAKDVARRMHRTCTNDRRNDAA